MLTVADTLTPPTAEPRLAVRCRGIVKEFGSGETRIRVLHGINLDIPTGAMTYIVGNEIYSHLEKIVDRFEDVANEIQGIVIDHA